VAFATRAETGVVADKSVRATFAADTRTIVPTAAAHGTISPSTTQTVDYGSSRTFAITPATGYHVATLKVDGTSVTATTTYNFTNVTANHTIAATFAINTYTVTPTAGAHGTISPSTAQTVDYGSSRTFTITPATGYHVATLKVDGTSVTATTTYTLTNVTASHTIAATFAIDTRTIVPTAGAHGAISPSTTQTVNYGSSRTFTITPATGYHVATLKVDSTTVAAATSYTFSNVTANHTISATFAINTYTVTPTAGANGTITPGGVQTIDYGSSRAFAITPATGYRVATLRVDGRSVTATTTYTFANVTANHTIAATFASSGSTPISTSSVLGKGTMALTAPAGSSEAWSDTPRAEGFGRIVAWMLHHYQT
jgi:hypothetical protein